MGSNEAPGWALRPITKKDQRAYRLAYGKKGNGAGFSAKTFMDHIGYDYSESRSTPVTWDEGESMYIAEIPMEYLRANPQQSLLAIEHSSVRRAK